MPDRMSEHMSGRMPGKMSEYMSTRMAANRKAARHMSDR